MARNNKRPDPSKNLPKNLLHGAARARLSEDEKTTYANIEEQLHRERAVRMVRMSRSAARSAMRASEMSGPEGTGTADGRHRASQAEADELIDGLLVGRDSYQTWLGSAPDPTTKDFAPAYFEGRSNLFHSPIVVSVDTGDKEIKDGVADATVNSVPDTSYRPIVPNYAPTPTPRGAEDADAPKTLAPPTMFNRPLAPPAPLVELPPPNAQTVDTVIPETEQAYPDAIPAQMFGAGRRGSRLAVTLARTARIAEQNERSA